MSSFKNRDSVLTAGLPIALGDGTVIEMSEEVAEALKQGAQLCVVQSERQLLAIQPDDTHSADSAVSAALEAFRQLGLVSDDMISDFFRQAIIRLEDDAIWEKVREANSSDVATARAKGHSTGRLEIRDGTRSGMIDGLRMWLDLGVQRNEVLQTVEHREFCIEQIRAPLGVVGFVFEGRPNVVIDACGVLLTGNTVVFRIGQDALGTARAILACIIEPALAQSGLPQGTVSLVDNASRGSGWALFSDTRLGLAVVRGSGGAVRLLGSIARQNGIPVSLHGRGGAWMFAGDNIAQGVLEEAVIASLDRKVCNTLNTFCVRKQDVQAILPRLANALRDLSQRTGKTIIVHATDASISDLTLLTAVDSLEVLRLDEDELGSEWEWDENPEISVLVIDDLWKGVELFNQHSPRFVASLLSGDERQSSDFFLKADCPFVGDGMTRWADGQLALSKPELGLSNWEHGRLLGRSAIMSGDSVYTIRTRYRTKAD